MEDYPSLAEVKGLENSQVGQTTRELEYLKILFKYSWLERTPDKREVDGSSPFRPTFWRSTQVAEEVPLLRV